MREPQQIGQRRLSSVEEIANSGSLQKFKASNDDAFANSSDRGSSAVRSRPANEALRIHHPEDPRDSQFLRRSPWSQGIT